MAAASAEAKGPAEFGGLAEDRLGRPSVRVDGREAAGGLGRPSAGAGARRMAEFESAGADGSAGVGSPAEAGGLAEAGDPAKAGREGIRGGGGDFKLSHAELIGLHQLPRRRRSGTATLQGVGSGELAVRCSVVFRQ